MAFEMCRPWRQFGLGWLDLGLFCHVPLWPYNSSCCFNVHWSVTVLMFNVKLCKSMWICKNLCQISYRIRQHMPIIILYSSQVSTYGWGMKPFKSSPIKIAIPIRITTVEQPQQPFLFTSATGITSRATSGLYWSRRFLWFIRTFCHCL